MSCVCCGSALKSLGRAAAKAAAARWRALGLAPTAPNWSARAESCVRCPLYVRQGGNAYCGRPFAQQVQREPALHGCGCPILAKARDPREHCPLDARNQPAARIGAACTCKWCQLEPVAMK